MSESVMKGWSVIIFSQNSMDHLAVQTHKLAAGLVFMFIVFTYYLSFLNISFFPSVEKWIHGTRVCYGRTLLHQI
jgi:hypothetical protein